jgi:hypothetical protein
MKTVFSNSQCAHVWAQQSQQHGRGSSVSFRGPSFKSYRTTIAKFVRAPNGGHPRDVVLFSSQSYSITTNGKHKANAWRAVRRLRSPWYRYIPTYVVPTVEAGGCNRHDLDHAANLAYLVQDYRDQGERMMRASHLYHESADDICAALAQTLAVATDYAADFGLPDPAPREISPASAARQIWARRYRLLLERFKALLAAAGVQS